MFVNKKRELHTIVISTTWLNSGRSDKDPGDCLAALLIESIKFQNLFIIEKTQKTSTEAQTKGKA